MAVKGKKTLKMGGSLDQNKHWGWRQCKQTHWGSHFPEILEISEEQVLAPCWGP